MKKIFLFIILYLVQSVSFISANEHTVMNLSEEKWEYRWGDSSFENNIPLWTIAKKDHSKWNEITFPSNPPNRNKQTNVWYRVQLPSSLPQDATLYIFSIDLISEVYYKTEKIYHFGDFDAQGKGSFQGWPWHMISLPQGSAGEYLYFRVYSNYTDIGLWGEVLIASKGQLYHKLLDDDIPKLMIGSIAIFVGVLFIISFISRWKKREFFILGLLFVAQGTDVLVSVKILELYLFFPLIKQYILASAFFFFPIGMALYMDKIFKNEDSFHIIKRVWQIHLLYFIGAICGALFGFFDIASTYEYFDILYIFITLPILTGYMIYFFFKGNKEVKIVTFSFFMISVYWLYSSLIAYGIVPWVEYPSDVAIFGCLLLLSYSIIHKLNYVEELENEKDALAIISSTDHLTQLKNRKEIDLTLEQNRTLFLKDKETFSIILLDIDNFKIVNDTHGHLVGDQVLIGVANILKQYTRQIDVVGRWGGEEFMVICPQTNAKKAYIVAEKLRKKIENYPFEIVGKQTASFGVTDFRDNDALDSLLLRADEAMYCSKHQGKNRVTIE